MFYSLFKSVIYRKLILPPEKKQQIKTYIRKFISNTLGTKYSLSIKKLLQKKDNLKNQNQQNKGYFCSELVAAAFKYAGLLNPNRSASQYWPGTFSTEKNIKLLNDAKLGPEQTVVLERDLNMI